MEEKMGIIAHQGLKKKKQGLTVLLKLWRHLWVTHLHTVPHQHILLSCLLLRIPLQRCGKDFTIMKVLPSGVYQYRFIVDGQWRYAPDLPWAQDGTGNANNILDLQVVVVDPEAYTYDDEVLKKAEAMGKPGLVEIYAKEDSFIFTVESIGAIKASQLVLNAIEILKQKLDAVRLSEDTVEADDQFGELGAHMQGG
ncbi:SNF1-related protein kinase regulatory subunit beta-1-like [Gossypium hirsutum]|uniref:SNF1-related protein kinase regulatory subunit beta-1-like n=1 Tax=Gossypium hirsutum TaxID=3635 RepID=A0ABM3BB51_GOSHI|nr:SNF1-related protein kinase regulatory subunit beta-1-like [Gossypium hirsutum]